MCLIECPLRQAMRGFAVSRVHGGLSARQVQEAPGDQQYLHALPHEELGGSVSYWVENEVRNNVDEALERLDAKLELIIRANSLKRTSG